MTEKRVAPYGTWESPVTAELLTKAGIGIGEATGDGDHLYWLELRPSEGGRSVLVRRDPDGSREDVTPADFSVRTAVHEYGGGAYAVRGGTVFFSNWADQRIYRQEPGEAPRAISPEPPRPRSLRYADLTMTPGGAFVVCVRESHPAEGEAVNEIVAVPSVGGEPVVLATGRDFYAAPRVSPAGDRIAWIEWDHPNMPWDGTELVVADLAPDGRAAGAEPTAGGPDESIFQPEWSPDGTLHFVSDRTGYWNLYARRPGGDVRLRPGEFDQGEPHWIFGIRTYGFLGDGRVALKEIREGCHHLFLLSPSGEELADLTGDDGYFAEVEAAGDRVLAVAAGSRVPSRLVAYEPSGAAATIATTMPVELDPAYFSRPEPVTFPTGENEVAHAFLYSPLNPDFAAPEGERPPLVVMSHGGPTAANAPMLMLGIQYFTTRGIAVVDVNYRGSTGYGRAYRNALRGRWGIADTEDCVNAARHLAAAGRVDGDRLAIRGGSAGGYTTLCALAFHDVFTCGVSRYGVADLEALARDTHKFESRYLDLLVGPYPERADVYRARSPLNHTDGFDCPVLVLQGEEDAVVPPAQSLAIVTALAAKGIPHAYLSFPGEQHGFRKAENIRRAIEAELSFYGRIFGFTPADDLPPLPLSP